MFFKNTKLLKEANIEIESLAAEISKLEISSHIILETTNDKEFPKSLLNN